MCQRRRPGNVVDIRDFVAIEQKARDQCLAEPRNWQGAYYVKKLGVINKATWEVQTTAAVSQLRLNGINDETEALLAVPELLGWSFYFAGGWRTYG